MCLGCNILNALGGSPVLKPPVYPGPLPGDIGSNGQPLTIHLLPFSKNSMSQALDIEEPTVVIEIPVIPPPATIGTFYGQLDAFLSNLRPSAWAVGRNQLDDRQFYAGQIFAVNNYDDARRAIRDIVSEGEGSKKSPLDFKREVAHYYRFKEVFLNQILTKDPNPTGYAWAGELGVEWDAVYPAIGDPGLHDFSLDPPEARAAQDACDEAFTRMVESLQAAVNGCDGQLGNAVRAMFELRLAARRAFTTPLADPGKVAGPCFRCVPRELKANDECP
jgi:hypothetical protein